MTIPIRIAYNESELIAAVRAADQVGTPVRLTGAGSAAGEPPHDGVLRVSLRGVDVNDDGCDSDALAFCGGVLVTAGAGLPWDDLVSLAVDRDWVGVECLAGRAGSVAGATIDNVAAFGQRVGDTVASVRTWDRVSGTRRRFAMADCGFDDHGSRFRRERMPDGSGRYVLLEVAFLFRQGQLTAPIRDDALAQLLGVRLGERATLAAMYDAVRTSRRRS